MDRKQYQTQARHRLAGFTAEALNNMNYARRISQDNGLPKKLVAHLNRAISSTERALAKIEAAWCNKGLDRDRFKAIVAEHLAPVWVMSRADNVVSQHIPIAKCLRIATDRLGDAAMAGQAAGWTAIGRLILRTYKRLQIDIGDFDTLWCQTAGEARDRMHFPYYCDRPGEPWGYDPDEPMPEGLWLVTESGWVPEQPWKLRGPGIKTPWYEL